MTLKSVHQMLDGMSVELAEKVHLLFMPNYIDYSDYDFCDENQVENYCWCYRDLFELKTKESQEIVNSQLIEFLDEWRQDAPSRYRKAKDDICYWITDEWYNFESPMQKEIESAYQTALKKNDDMTIALALSPFAQKTAELVNSGAYEAAAGSCYTIFRCLAKTCKEHEDWFAGFTGYGDTYTKLAIFTETVVELYCHLRQKPDLSKRMADEMDINLEVFNLETDFFGDLHCSSRFTDMLCDAQTQYGDYSELDKCPMCGMWEKEGGEGDKGPTGNGREREQREYKSEDMKVVRTFHPVGQGAFYSERFFFHDGNQLKSKHNIVFDCGVMRWPEWMMYHVVKSAFTDKDEIDHLFISHLDYDHLSLVNTLLKTVKCVKDIVLPLVSEEYLILAMTYYQTDYYYDNDMVAFFSEVINRMDNRPEKLTVHFVGEEKQKEMTDALIWPRGQVREAQWKPDWVFIPYNMNYCSRRQELHDEFEKVVKDKAFTDAIKLNGIEPIKDADDLFERLKNSEFTKIVLTIRELRKTIKGSYEKISGKTNENSLLLYSGPIESDGVYRMLQTLPFRSIRYHDLFRTGCLYTGDNTCDMEDWEKKYADVWKYIGTIQLPHHGSVDSFDVTKNVIDRRYVLPVSYGCDNLYGHPSGEVLAYLLANRCCVESVTEKADSVYMQRIERY